MTFDHLAISVDNIAESLRFYLARFPHLEILHEDATWAFVRIDSVKIAFVLEEQHPPHLAFTVASREELEQLAQRDAASVTAHRDGSESYYVDDPSGNAIEFVYYPPK